MGYWGEICRRVTRRTNQALGVEAPGRAMLTVVFAVLALLSLWLLGYGEDAKVELIFRIVGTAVVVLAWPLVWLVSYFFEQPRLYSEITGERDVLKARFEPNIVVDGPLEWRDPKNEWGTAEKFIRTYRLRVSNKCAVAIKDCRVRLKDMIDVTGEHSSADGTAFMLKTDVERNAEHKQQFDIAPGSSEDVNIAQYDERTRPTHIRMFYAVKGANDDAVLSRTGIPVDKCPQELVIEVTAANCPAPIIGTFKLWIDVGGHFKLDPI